MTPPDPEGLVQQVRYRNNGRFCQDKPCLLLEHPGNNGSLGVCNPLHGSQLSR